MNKTGLALAVAAGSFGAALAARTLREDETLALLSEGYEFIPNRCEHHRSDLFETRLMLTRAVCITGEEAAEVFYEPGRFTRKGALPQTTLRLLQDRGSAQVLDGEAHRWRKRMFMSLMSPEGIRRLNEGADDCWRAGLGRWEGAHEVVLLGEVEEILCRAACAWAGVPLAESEAEQRTREFAAMIDGAGSVGPRNWRGHILRRRTERWIRGIVGRVRAGELDAPEGSAAHAIAFHRGPDGKPLEEEVAAVELINVLRPVVAVARFVTFAALALHEHPECARELRTGDDGHLERFVQEVRRFYPFFPFVGGRAREDFGWRGRRFSRGSWVLLDLYGTNRDSRIWGTPRFSGPTGSASGTGVPSASSPKGAAIITPITVARASGSPSSS
jgi:fatty-acid peroxygenase